MIFASLDRLPWTPVLVNATVCAHFLLHSIWNAARPPRLFCVLPLLGWRSSRD